MSSAVCEDVVNICDDALDPPEDVVNESGKACRDPCSPMGVTVHWYRVPLPGTVKLVMGRLALSSACCQNPLVKSIVVNVSDDARPISSMQSLILRMVYLRSSTSG